MKGRAFNYIKDAGKGLWMTLTARLSIKNCDEDDEDDEDDDDDDDDDWLQV